MRRSRFFNPAQSLQEQLANGCSSPQDLSLRYAFARLPQVKLGTELDRDINKHAGIPKILRDRANLDVARKATQSKPIPGILIARTAQDAFAFNARISAGTAIRNRLWTVREFCEQSPTYPADMPKVAECFVLDPDNLDLLERLAMNPVEATLALQQIDISAIHVVGRLRHSTRFSAAPAPRFGTCAIWCSVCIPRSPLASVADCPRTWYAPRTSSAWSKRAQLFEEAAAEIGAGTEKSTNLGTELARFRAAQTYEAKRAVFAGHFYETAVSARRSAGGRVEETCCQVRVYSCRCRDQDLSRTWPDSSLERRGGASPQHDGHVSRRHRAVVLSQASPHAWVAIWPQKSENA